MEPQPRTPRGLKEISGLFITPKPRAPEPEPSARVIEAAPSEVADAAASSEPSPAADVETLAVGLSAGSTVPGGFYLALSLCRRFLACGRDVTLVAERPEGEVWASLADRFGLPVASPTPLPRPIQAYRLHEDFRLIVGEDPASMLTAGAESPDAETYGAGATSAGDGAPRGGKVVVHLSRQPGTEAAVSLMSMCDLWIELLRPSVADFADYYRFLKRAGPAREGCRLWAILASQGASVDLAGIERAWGGIGPRFLNASVEFVGEIDMNRLAAGGAPRSLAETLRLCEEALPLRERVSALRPGPRESPTRSSERSRWLDWVRRWERTARPGSL